MALTDEQQRQVQKLLDEADVVAGTRTGPTVDNATGSRWGWMVVAALEHALGSDATMVKEAKAQAALLPSWTAVEKLWAILAVVVDARARGYDPGNADRYVEAKLVKRKAAVHVTAAMPVLMTVSVTFGILALASIAVGCFALIKSASGETHLEILGAKLNTTNVGVAMLLGGLIVAYFATRAVLNTTLGLARVPRD